MSSRTAAARKRLQDPLPRVTPFISTPENLSMLAPPLRDAPPMMHTSNIQPLDLSNEFTQPIPSPVYSPTYYIPPFNPPSLRTSNIQQLGSNEFTQPLPSPVYSPIDHFPPPNHLSFQNIESSRTVQAASSSKPSPQTQWSHTKPKKVGLAQSRHTVLTYDPSPYEEDNRQRRPLLRVDPDVVNYQNLPPHPSLGPTPASTATGSFPYVHDSPIPPKYTTPFSNNHSDHLPTSPYPLLSRPNRHSLTPSALPEYREIYSSHMDGHTPVATTTLDSKSKRRNDQSTSHQPPFASNPPAQLAAVSISPTSVRNDSRLPFRYLPSAQNSSHDSSSHSSCERPGDSISLSSVSSPSSSTPTSNGTSLPPAPPPSPTFFFPGSRSSARPKVTSKITNSQFKKRRSQSKLHRGSSQISPTSSVSPSDAQLAFETAPVSSTLQPPTQSYQQDTSPKEGSFVLCEDYRQKLAHSVPKPPPDIFVFPTARSRAQPKISKSSKRYSYSSKSGDDTRGPSRFIETLFKRKSKGKTSNITPIPNSILDPVDSGVESTDSKGKRISVESTSSTGQQERTRKMKYRRGDYPLDPYNSVLLDNDRHTSELLSRLNPTGSPSFHDYGTAPPSSVLDLGCGQGHWVLEAAVAWKAYGTHVTGYDMIDISKRLLPWAAEQGVGDNIQFVKGNFLKHQLPFESNTFDLVRMSCLALCIPSGSWSLVLQEACRVLKTGGRLELIDDQMFFPYGKMSSLMDDTNSVAESVTQKHDFVLSPMASTLSVYGDVVVNPGLGSAVGHRGSDDGSDLDGDLGALHGHKGKVTATVSSVQPRIKPSIILDPEAWDQCASMAQDLEELFEHMLSEVFDIYKDSFEFVLALMESVFGQAREIETMNLVLAPPNSTAKSERPPQQGLSHCPGLILWPSTFIPMDHTETEIHASKHLRTLLSCKNFLAQHAIEMAEKRVDDEFVSEALWEYESFLGHRFNPPVPYNEHSGPENLDTTSILGSIAESTNEAMWDLQTEFRRRYAWQPERPPKTYGTQHDPLVGTPTPPGSSPSDSGSSTTSNGLTHIRTFRVYEAVKHTSIYDGH